jgi:hypothetical protein
MRRLRNSTIALARCKEVNTDTQEKANGFKLSSPSIGSDRANGKPGKENYPFKDVSQDFRQVGKYNSEEETFSKVKVKKNMKLSLCLTN